MSQSLQVQAHGAAAAIAHLSDAQMQLIKNTVARNCSNDELSLFLHICTKYDLDPFTKEAWCLKYGSNQPATIFTSRDGYMKIANNNPQMDGLQSDVVYANDTLTKLSDGGVAHVYGSPDRGTVVGAYALVYRKDRSRPTYFYAPMSEYNNGRNPTWKNYPSAMIVKVAEAMALKRAFSISGLVAKEEMDSSQSYTTPEEQETHAEEVATAEVIGSTVVEPTPAVSYATASQKEEIIRLLNHPVITRQEKTKMLLNINRLDEERATAAIEKLRKAIDDRENAQPTAA